jgi:hypothetical protein
MGIKSEYRIMNFEVTQKLKQRNLGDLRGLCAEEGD